jgi:predicted small secreted protein
MKLYKLMFAAGVLASLAVSGCATVVPAGGRFAATGQASQDLFRCRFEQPGRGERMLKLKPQQPAVAACLARAANTR